MQFDAIRKDTWQRYARRRELNHSLMTDGQDRAAIVMRGRLDCVQRGFEIRPLPGFQTAVKICALPFRFLSSQTSSS